MPLSYFGDVHLFMNYHGTIECEPDDESIVTMGSPYDEQGKRLDVRLSWCDGRQACRLSAWWF